MNKFSDKSYVYLPLMAIVIGVIPVLLLPAGQILSINKDFDFDKYHLVMNAIFPFSFGAHSLIWIEFILILPIVAMLGSLIAGKKAYHGIYALFVVIGFMLKTHKELDVYSFTLLGVMGVLSAINIMAYLYATGDSFDDWLVYYISASRAKQAIVNVSNSSGLGSAIMYPSRRSLRSFADVIGMAELKAKLSKAGKEILENKGARNGILLTGEPGNGKTSMAEALAGELKLPIIDVAFGNFVSMWVGETTQRVMKVFDDAEKQAPCILFIDEIEAVLIDRAESKNADQEATKTVASMLKRLEEIRRKKVVVVAATNFLEKLDPASIREGRFDYKIEVLPPDFEARKYLLIAGLKTVANVVDATGVERAAKRWEGFSVSRIRAIAAEALDQLKDKKIDSIGFDELAQALRSLNATMGDKIPENALSIEQLVLEPEMRSRMLKLATRMVNIEQIEEMGGSVPAGVLFYGPAGTGKTIAAMALAIASKWAFIKTSGHDLLHDPKKMDDIMRKAKDIRPCIIFIDEADDVLADRRSSMISKDVTNKLLTIMDGAGGKTKDILFIAATNAPDLIDEAMLRGGRFTEKVAFDVPGDDALHEYVSKWIATTKAPLTDDFTAYAAVNVLSGQSLANVGEILQSAVNEAISIGMNKDFKVSLVHLKTAISLVQGA
jgi:transitional endoplasmic reticulum ATPase